MAQQAYFLAGDIGGTNTRLQLFRVEKRAQHVQGQR